MTKDEILDYIFFSVKEIKRGDPLKIYKSYQDKFQGRCEFDWDDFIDFFRFLHEKDYFFRDGENYYRVKTEALGFQGFVLSSLANQRKQQRHNAFEKTYKIASTSIATLSLIVAGVFAFLNYNRGTEIDNLKIVNASLQKQVDIAKMKQVELTDSIIKMQKQIAIDDTVLK